MNTCQNQLSSLGGNLQQLRNCFNNEEGIMRVNMRGGCQIRNKLYLYKFSVGDHLHGVPECKCVRKKEREEFQSEGTGSEGKKISEGIMVFWFREREFPRFRSPDYGIGQVLWHWPLIDVPKLPAKWFQNDTPSHWKSQQWPRSTRWSTKWTWARRRDRSLVPAKKCSVVSSLAWPKSRAIVKRPWGE